MAATIRSRRRVPLDGKVLLVDYKDQGSPLRYFLGHGVYTRYEAMLFNTEQTYRALYGS